MLDSNNWNHLTMCEQMSSWLFEMLLLYSRNTYTTLYIYMWRCPWCKRRCPWCNGYRHRKWTRRHEFISWPRLVAFLVALIPLRKVWIQLFSLQLWVNSRTDLVLQPWWGNLSKRMKTLNLNLLNFA